MNTANPQHRMKISINLGITSALTLLILLTTVTLCSLILWNLREILRDDLQKQLFNTLRMAALSVDGSKLPDLRESSQENSENYLAVKRSLQTIQAGVSDLHFVYTMRKESDGKLVFVVDAETDPDTLSHIGDLYTEATPTMLQAFASKTIGQTFIEREPSPDEWGTWLSGFIVLGDGKRGVAGILGIDISASTIAEYELKAVKIMIAVSAGVSLLVLVLGLFLSRRITSPMKALEADMDRITKFQIDDHTTISSIFTEIRRMSDAVDNMKTSLRAFKRYVPADLVAELITLHKEASLGGERRDLSILFSDIEGFTTWSEKLEPEQLIQLMAGYFSGMTRIIHAHHGTVDKYIGDSIMAFWGAPNPLSDHAKQAALAALECIKFQQEFNRDLVASGLPALNTRFGINTGEVLVGNVGYDERLNYTVMGDHVNLASRLESLNKLYATKIIISENTRLRLGNDFVSRPVDSVVVKGKTEGITIHELLALKEDASSQDPNSENSSLVKSTLTAFDLYSRKDWAGATEAYNEILLDFPQDGPARLMHERCRKFLVQAPGPDWQGVIVLHEK